MGERGEGAPGTEGRVGEGERPVRREESDVQGRRECHAVEDRIDEIEPFLACVDPLPGKVAADQIDDIDAERDATISKLVTCPDFVGKRVVTGQVYL